ncbi:MAG: hypothetical protein WCP14_04700 [bacterium]
MSAERNQRPEQTEVQQAKEKVIKLKNTIYGLFDTLLNMQYTKPNERTETDYKMITQVKTEIRGLIEKLKLYADKIGPDEFQKAMKGITGQVKNRLNLDNTKEHMQTEASAFLLELGVDTDTVTKTKAETYIVSEPPEGEE